MKRSHIYHPFLFVLFPVLSLYSYNVGQVFFPSVLPVLVILLVGTLLAFSFLNWLLKNGSKAGLIISLFVLSFFSYGHVYDYGWQLGRFLPHRFFILLWAAVFMVGAILIVLSQRDARNLTKILNFISISLIVVSSSEILLSNFESGPKRGL